MTKFQWLLKQLSGKLWVRTSAFGVLAVVTALAALFLKDFIPEDISQKIGADSVDSLLHIIANSMLAVTTFSLSIMVAAYSAATTHVTPRSTQLLLADNTSQNALSVFIGSFIFSVVGIIALTMGIYGESGRLVLFAVTIAVILIIVVVLIRWINYLSKLGRVTETIDKVEQEAAKSIKYLLDNPNFNASPLSGFIPDNSHHMLTSSQIGYVQHIDMEFLEEKAVEYGCYIYVQYMPGSFNDGIGPLAYTSCKLPEEKAGNLVRAFTISGDRSFTQDPRFGLIVLSEIASRALSPAVNDPGTAIDIIGTGVRVLMPWVCTKEGAQHEVRYPHVFVPRLETSELFEAIFNPIARDGAGMIEVGIHLQKALGSLAAAGGSMCQEAARKYSHQSFDRAKKSLVIEEDVARLSKYLLPPHGSN